MPTTTQTPTTSTPNATAEQVLNAQNWRYATKVFDAHRKLTAQQWHTLEQSLVLTPSSYGLQPWRFYNITDTTLRGQMRPVSWNQSQVTDASHYVVFASRTKLDANDVQNYINRVSEVRGVPTEQLEQYKQLMLSDIVNGPRSAISSEWSARQTYIALGNLMTTCAMMGIDTCPMEGLDPAAYDKLLNLEGTGYRTVCALAIGFRATEDKYAHLPKVRYNSAQLLVTK